MTDMLLSVDEVYMLLWLMVEEGCIFPALTLTVQAVCILIWRVVCSELNC